MSKPEMQFSTPTEQSAENCSPLKRQAATAFPPKVTADAFWEAGSLNANQTTEAAESDEPGTGIVTPIPKLAVRFATDGLDERGSSRRRSFPRVPTPHPREFARLIRKEEKTDESENEDEKMVAQ